MGQEVVSELNDLSVSMCNLDLCKPNVKDDCASGKESSMKINGKKRIFALLMCAMMIVSSMSVWAGYTSKRIGSGSSDSALCELNLSATSGRAYTTPNSSATAVSTAIAVLRSDSNDPVSNAGGSYTSVSGSNFVFAVSTHQAGAYYTELQVNK